MCFYIGIEDLAANALIEKLTVNDDNKTCVERCVTYSELEQYGTQVIRYLGNKGEKAVLILSRESTSLMFRNYSDFFEEIKTSNGDAISLKEGKTVQELIEKFRTYLSLDVMMAFMNEQTVSVLRAQ